MDKNQSLLLASIVFGIVGFLHLLRSISKKLMDLSLQYNKPLGFGIIGPRVTWQQAEKRALEYSKRAVKAALEMVKVSRK